MENKTTTPEITNEEISKEQQLAAIQETMENESDDWFIDQILNNTQPDFWWVY